jgi:hypothetical protein
MEGNNLVTYYDDSELTDYHDDSFDDYSNIFNIGMVIHKRSNITIDNHKIIEDKEVMKL